MYISIQFTNIMLIIFNIQSCRVSMWLWLERWTNVRTKVNVQNQYVGEHKRTDKCMCAGKCMRRCTRWEYKCIHRGGEKQNVWVWVQRQNCIEHQSTHKTRRKPTTTHIISRRACGSKKTTQNRVARAKPPQPIKETKCKQIIST